MRVADIKTFADGNTWLLDQLTKPMPALARAQAVVHAKVIRNGSLHILNFRVWTDEPNKIGKAIEDAIKFLIDGAEAGRQAHERLVAHLRADELRRNGPPPRAFTITPPRPIVVRADEGRRIPSVER